MTTDDLKAGAAFLLMALFVLLLMCFLSNGGRL